MLWPRSISPGLTPAVHAAAYLPLPSLCGPASSRCRRGSRPSAGILVSRPAARHRHPHAGQVRPAGKCGTSDPLAVDPVPLLQHSGLDLPRLTPSGRLSGDASGVFSYGRAPSWRRATVTLTMNGRFRRAPTPLVGGGTAPAQTLPGVLGYDDSAVQECGIAATLGGGYVPRSKRSI